MEFVYSKEKPELSFMEIRTGMFSTTARPQRAKAYALEIQFVNEIIDDLVLTDEEIYVCKMKEKMIIRVHISNREWRTKYHTDWLRIIIPFKQDLIRTEYWKKNMLYLFYEDPFEAPKCMFEIMKIEGIIDIQIPKKFIELD